MTTTPARKHSVRRSRGHLLSHAKRKAIRRRGLKALRYWQHLTRCFGSFHRRPARASHSMLRSLRRVLGAAMLALWLPALAQAETFLVNSSSDLTDDTDNALTLREAIAQANETPGPDTIRFEESLIGATITLTEGQLTISDELSIDASDLPKPPVIDADRKSRVMEFTAPQGDLDLAGLILQNGTVTTSDARGGGIRFNSNGTLRVTKSTIRGNTLGAAGPWPWPTSSAHGGAIESGTGDVILTDSTLSDNSLIGGSAAYGGGISTGSGDISLTNSTIKGSSIYGYYSGGGGISTSSGEITIVNSSINGNLADGYYSGAGGIDRGSGAVTILNSTISGNRSTGSGCSYAGGISSGTGALVLTNSTVYGNECDYGSGGINGGWGPIILTNSIIAGNRGTQGAPDLSPPANPSSNLQVSHCLIGNRSGSRLGEAAVSLGNITDVDPLLSGLGDHGGPTDTHLPLPGSPAINAGVATDLDLDQRGFSRSGTPDIGAVEYQGPRDLSEENLKQVFDTDHDGDGVPFGVEQALGTDPTRPDLDDPRHLGAPVFNAQGKPTLSFGVSPDAAPGTIWILECSTDLVTFHEIHRFDGLIHGGYDQALTHVTPTETGVTITHQNPPAGSAFYRLRIALGKDFVVPPPFVPMIIEFDDLDAQAGVAYASANRYHNKGVLFDREIPVYDVAAREAWFAPYLWSAGGSQPNAVGLANSFGSLSIEMTFVVPGTSTPATTDSVQAVFGDSNVGTTLGRIEAFDKDGNLIDSATATTNSDRAGILRVEAPGIARVRLSSDADGCAVDSIVFNMPVQD